MNISGAVKKAIKLSSVRAYKSDAITFLAFDLDKALLNNFAGFSING